MGGYALPQVAFSFRVSISDKFKQFHEDNPQVYNGLVSLAREMKAAGYQQYSIDALYHVLRYRLDRNPKTRDKYKLNDHMTSRFSRLIQQQEPDLAGFFKTRSLRAS